MPVVWTVLLVVVPVVSVSLWYRTRYQKPLKILLSTLDLGGDSAEEVVSKGVPLVRHLSRRALDYEKIIMIQQAELERSQHNAELLLDSLDLFVGYFSLDFAPRYVNRYGRCRLDILDRSMEEVTFSTFIEPEFMRRIWKQVRRQGLVQGMDGRVILPVEGERDVRLSILPTGQAFQMEQGYLVLVEDVSRQRRVELNLQNQIALSQHIFDSIPEFILVVDVSMTIIFANGSVTRYTGMEKMLGRSILSILSVQAQADGFDEYLRMAIKNNQQVNRINIINPLGAGNNFVDLMVKPLHRGKRQIGALILIRDVSEWRELTEEIRSLQSFTDKVINASPYALLSIDGQDMITVWNQSAENLFNRKTHQVLGLELFSVVPALKAFHDLITEVKVIGRSHFESEQELIIEGQFRLVNMNFYSIYNNGTNVVVSIEDITAVRALQRSLSDAQKMGTLGMLTRGIVHDLNNMLTGILGRASILKKKMDPDSDLQKDVDIITRSGEQVSELISRIHQFSKQRLDREKPVCLNQVVNQTLDLLRPNLQGIRVIVNTGKEDQWVIMDQTKISQIVVNLVVNAKDAVKGRPQPELRIDLDTLELRGHEQVMDGLYDRLRVTDNGTGIARENLEKIFMPFFTTKTSEHGTGIGLSTVQTLVNEANGVIDVDSESGKGTVFSILLPHKSPPTALTSDGTDLSDMARPLRPRAVLLIDDEAVVRDIGAEMLETLDVKAFTAVDGVDGLRTFEEHRDEIDLILLDVEMPAMGGEETFQRLREQGCLCPIVIASGYNRDYLERQVFSRGLEHYLAKPFQITQLNALFKELEKTGVLKARGGKDAQ